MNGPEHFAKAEECFSTADREGPSYEDAGLWLDLGVGHALLAIAALLAERSPDPRWNAIQAAAEGVSNGEDAAERAAFKEWGPA